MAACHKALEDKVTENLVRIKVEHDTYLECMKMDPKSQPVQKFISKYQFSADRRIKTILGF